MTPRYLAAHLEKQKQGEGGKTANTRHRASRTLCLAKHDSGKLGGPMSHFPGTVTIEAVVLV